MLKRWLLGGAAGGLIVLAVLGWWRMSDRAPDEPQVSLDKNEQAFGTVRPGQPLSAEFRIRNLGRKPLLISDLRSSCGCAPAKLTKFTIEHNEEALLTVEFQAKPYAGKFFHMIRFRTNDPRLPEVGVGLSAMAQWPVEANPIGIEKSGIARGTTASTELRLYSPNRSSFGVTKIETTAPWIRVHEAATSSSEHTRQFRVDVVGEETGSFSESIRFTTTSADRPLIIVPVTGNVVAMQRVTPDQILLGAVDVGKPRAIFLVLRSAAKECEAKSITFSDPQWSVASWQQQRIDAQRLAIRGLIRLPPSEGYKRTVLTLKVSDDDKPLHVPIGGYVSATLPAVSK